MRLRGIFNPKIHIIIAVILITISVWTLFGLLSHANDVSFVRLDLHLIPVGLLLGLGVGVPVGIWRLHALHKALPDLDGQFYLSDADVLRQSLEGRNARTLQQIGFGLAVAIWFILLLHTGGQVILFGTTVFYILGQYLTGQFLPAIRLLIEIRRGDSSGPPRTS